MAEPLPLVGRTLYARAVLLDTGALLALANETDAHHPEAIGCLNEINRLRLPTFITLPTVYEAHRRLLFDAGRSVASQFLASIDDGSVTLVRTIEVDEIEARRLIDRYEGLQLTLTDAASMAVMSRLGIARCFSFDRHFLVTGLIRVPPLQL